MCDYSLMCYPNRLAVEGEELVVRRFPSGSKGLASPADLPKHPARRSLWSLLKEIFVDSQNCSVPAVCVPPGACLILRDVDPGFRSRYECSTGERVRFHQLTTEVNTYRDSLRFENGGSVRVQDLPEGMRLLVASLGGEDPSVGSGVLAAESPFEAVARN
jgi:hypothetical protein